MFDVGFTELLVIGVVALIVIGPEKLPAVARTLGHLLGRAQRYVNDVKSDINREMQLEELKRLQSQLQTQITDSARTFEQSIKEGLQEAKGAVELAGSDLQIAPTASVPSLENTANDAATGVLAAPATSHETPVVSQVRS